MGGDVKPSTRSGRLAWRWSQASGRLAPSPVPARHEEERPAHLLDAEARRLGGRRVKPSTRGGRLAWRWCRAYGRLAPSPVQARHEEERLAHLLDAEAAGVPGWRLAAEAAKGALADVHTLDRARRRAGLPPLVEAPFGPGPAVGLASVLVAVSYVASVFAAFPVPHQIKFAAMRGAGAVLAVALLHRLRPVVGRWMLDGGPLSSYKSSWARTDRAEGGRLVQTSRRKVFIGLGIAIVVTFLLSAVGQDKTPSDGGLYWVGAIAWAAFGVSVLATLAFAIFTLATRRSRREVA